MFCYQLVSNHARPKDSDSARKTALRKLLKHEPNGIQYVEHIEGDGDAMFKAVCKLGLEGIVSKEIIRALSLRAVEKLD